MATSQPSFVFDLDGTLLDSVYHHVIAWQRAFADIGLDVAMWRVHRRVGMSGSLLAARVARESGRQLRPSDEDRVTELHTQYYAEARDAVHPLPGARELLSALSAAEVGWVIATSGTSEEAAPALGKLSLDTEPRVVTSDDVDSAKPGPDLFLAGAQLLGTEPQDCLVVGDTIWDVLAARRAEMAAVGISAGGISEERLERAGALRVYADPADLHSSLDEFGVIV